MSEKMSEKIKQKYRWFSVIPMTSKITKIDLYHFCKNYTTCLGGEKSAFSG